MAKAFRRFTKERDGAAAVEFAIIAPIFILTLLTMLAYGIYLSTAHAVQQMAADAARQAVAGLDAAERSEIVHDYLHLSLPDYVFIRPEKLDITVADDAAAAQFTVRLTYDARDLPIWGLFTFPLPSTDIERSSTVRFGGA